MDEGVDILPPVQYRQVRDGWRAWCCFSLICLSGCVGVVMLGGVAAVG